MFRTTNIIEQELGHLIIYKKTTLLHPFGDGKLYYMDKRDVSQSELGPFSSISHAVEHWGAYMVPLVTPDHAKATSISIEIPKAPAIVEPPMPNNVIYVDFQTKKRRA